MIKLSTLFPVLLLGIAVGLPGTAAADYDCANAADDIKRLNAEKDSTAARAAAGITAILPIGIVVHSVEGNEQQSLNEMGTDEHNQQLDARISQIKSNCNTQ